MAVSIRPSNFKSADRANLSKANCRHAAASRSSRPVKTRSSWLRANRCPLDHARGNILPVRHVVEINIASALAKMLERFLRGKTEEGRAPFD
jgi:hypothetical protein